jgi:DME family drug/metabolite transporter
MGVGFSLFNYGARSVKAGEMWVLSNVEIVFGPFLVWLFVSEVPLTTTFVGGTIVVVAIVSQAVMTARNPAAI